MLRVLEQTFTAIDKKDPTIAIKDITVDLPAKPQSCHTSITMLKSGLAAAAKAAAADNCDKNPTIAFSPAPAEFLVGETVVEVTATDKSNNAFTTKVTVVVTDTTPPIISGCPSDISVDVADRSGSATVKWVEPTVSDNQCGATIVNVANNLPKNGAKWNIGTYTVRYMATDKSSKTRTSLKAICEFKVVVHDDKHAPEFLNCPKKSLKFECLPGASIVRPLSTCTGLRALTAFPTCISGCRFKCTVR